jgi:hypothetical protein
MRSENTGGPQTCLRRATFGPQAACSIALHSTFIWVMPVSKCWSDHCSYRMKFTIILLSSSRLMPHLATSASVSSAK